MAAGGKPHAIAPEKFDQSHARWSPDGRQITYVSNHNGTYDLRIVPADGGVPKVLVAPDGMGVIGKPEWSPNGRQISYTMTTPLLPEDMYVVSVENGRAQKLTTSMPEGLAGRVDAHPQQNNPTPAGAR